MFEVKYNLQQVKVGTNRENRKVLVSIFEELGQVAMTIPTVYDACAANPGIEFVYLTCHHESQVLINAPANLTVVPVNLANYSGLLGMKRLAQALCMRYGITHYLALIDDKDTRRLRTFMRLRGVKNYAIDSGKRAKKELTRPQNKMLVQLKPMHERYKDLFYKAEIALSNDFDTIWCKQKGDTSLFAGVSGPKRDGEHWLAIAPFARHRGRIYPIDQMDRVVEHFSKRGDTRIFILGFGDQEAEAIAKIARRHERVVNMAAASLGLKAELALLSHCDTMLSMDSADMHLASLVGLRTESVWGATHPYTGFLGWRQRTRDVVQLDMTCRPCSVFGDKPCPRGDYHCLAGITPRMIIDKIEEHDF